MYRFTAIACLLFTASLSFGQFQWQDPLGFIDIGLADKYGLVFNLGGWAISDLIAADQDRPRHWEISLMAERHMAYGSESPATKSFMGRARLGNQVYRWFQVGIEGTVYRFEEPGRISTGLGGSIYFNWYFINRRGFRLYFDNGFGVACTDRRFPKGGTRFNFTRYYGLHMGFRTGRATYLTIGAHTFHLSNAYLFGDNRNPAFDSVGVTVGISKVLTGQWNQR